MTRTGQCHCGAVRFAVHAEPKLVVHCHCTNCRRAHGAAFFTGGFLAENEFEVTAGADQLEMAAFHGDFPGGRLFCKRCGSRVYNRLEMIPGLVNFPVASLDDAPETLDGIHINVENKVAWIEIPESAEQHAGFPPDLQERIGRVLGG